jgi:hypothetical protein
MAFDRDVVNLTAIQCRSATYEAVVELSIR